MKLYALVPLLALVAMTACKDATAAESPTRASITLTAPAASNMAFAFGTLPIAEALPMLGQPMFGPDGGEVFLAGRATTANLVVRIVAGSLLRTDGTHRAEYGVTFPTLISTGNGLSINPTATVTFVAQGYPRVPGDVSNLNAKPVIVRETHELVGNSAVISLDPTSQLVWYVESYARFTAICNGLGSSIIRANAPVTTTVTELGSSTRVVADRVQIGDQLGRCASN
jgi:hypothetical protein